LTDLKQAVAELEQRLTVSAAEREELLLQQIASAEILQVINNSRGNLAAVFDAILEKATLLCGAGFSALAIHKGGDMHEVVALRGAPPALADMLQAPVRLGPETGLGRLVRGESFVHIVDAADDEGYRLRNPVRVALVDVAGARSYLAVPIQKDDVMLGSFTIYRREVRPFSPKSIALLQSFAAQAAIAMENARLFNETQEALERQTATADILKVIASSPDDVQPVFEAIAERSKRLVGGHSTAVYRFIENTIYLAAFTRVSPEADDVLQRTFPRPLADYPFIDLIRGGDVTQIPDTESYAGAMSADVQKVAHARGFRSALLTPLTGAAGPIGLISVTRKESGSFADKHVQLLRTFADQAVIAISNVGLFQEVQARTKELACSLEDLRAAQGRLVQTEKLASLGQLTAGIAHEIKNPLNFVTNFSELSAELVREMKAALLDMKLDENKREELDEIAQTLQDNLEKVVHHGKRADSIVKNMLQHSREGASFAPPISTRSSMRA
jgi:two-component system NtrC family sensor kinase